MTWRWSAALGACATWLGCADAVERDAPTDAGSADAGRADAVFYAPPEQSDRSVTAAPVAVHPDELTPPAAEPALPPSPGPVVLRLLGDTGIEAFVTHPAPDDDLGYGPVAALVDFDQDGAIDLFLAGEPGSGQAGCVYRNVSRTHVAFERIAAWCLPEALRVEAATAHPSRPGELVLVGNDVVSRFDAAGVSQAPEFVVHGSAEPPCAVSGLLWYDVDLDGAPELLAGCQVRGLSSDPGSVRPLRLWTTGATGDLPDTAPLVGAAANTLALASSDVDEDGLFDVLAVVDTFSGPLIQNASADPGGARLRVGPGDEGGWREVRFGLGPAGWGSYMGIAEARVAGAPAFTLTDYGQQRLVRFAQGAFRSLAATWPFVQSLEEPWLYSWAALSEDLDGNGVDDLLVTQGLLPSGEAHWAAHTNLALVQNRRGGFTALSEAAGLLPSFPPAEDVGTPARSSRGLVRADFDGDGALEFVVLAYDGPPEIYTLDSGGTRCAVTAVPRVVPTLGWGVAYGPSVEGPWAMRHIQGQLRVSDSNVVYPPAPRGYLRFASGAVVEVDCGASRRVTVAEPDWIGVDAGEGAQAGRAVLRVDPAVAAGPITAWAERSAAGVESVFAPSTAGERDGVVVGDDAVAVMIQVDQRWVGRWFDVPR